MALLPETNGSTYPTPRQIENGEAQAGGINGLWNEHAKAMVERTNWLKTAIAALQSAFLPTATQAQAEAGTHNATAMTPLRVKQFAVAGFAVNFAENGYIKFPSWLGGLIFNWGWVTSNTASTTAFFPLAFPNACVFAIANADQATFSTSAEYAHVSAKGPANIVIASYQNNNGSAVGRISFFSVGY